MPTPYKSQRVPWSDTGELVAWFLLLVVATLLIHNGMRVYRKRRL